jgi:hypothetical protein
VKRFLALLSTGVIVGSLVAIALPSRVGAWALTATPAVFIGGRGDCGQILDPASGTLVDYPPGSMIVSSQWVWGLGLPDSGGGNTTNTINPTNPDTKSDPHLGLLLSKNGPTQDCSSAGANINGEEGMIVDIGFYLGFDYRNGGHCGGGAPRYNVNYKLPVTGAPASSFVGNCSLAATSPAVQDPLEWTTLRWNVTATNQAFPPIPVGSTITSIEVVFDEGTDTVGAEDPRGIGLATIDNLNINGTIIRGG